MPVYELVPAERKAEILSHLLMLSRSWRRNEPGSEPEVRGILSPDLITNIRKFGYTPSPRQLHAISQYLNLTIGGAFKLFGYSLESMRQLDFRLNGARTRLIEAYPFYRDRPVDVPSQLGTASALRQNSTLFDLVRSWRHQVPIRTIRGPHWRRHTLLYAQVGTSDEGALPAIPPGAIIAIREINEDERKNPDPERYYFLQHHAGYSCCRCVVDKGRLLLLTTGQRVCVPQEFAYPSEARIAGRVLFFATSLSIGRSESIDPHMPRSDTQLVFPWEQTSFAALLTAERRRFGITEVRLNTMVDALEEHLGVGLSARTLRRYEHNGKLSPRTAALLAMVAVLSLRPSDVLRLLRLWNPGVQQFSLTAMMKAEKADQLTSMSNPASAPAPTDQWHRFLEEWGEWPLLLSTAFPDFAPHRHGILRMGQDPSFQGLNPLIRSGSIVQFDDHDITPPKNGRADPQFWNRPIYVVRHQGEILCGYLEASATHVALQPHPLAGVPRMVFHQKQIQIMGRAIAVASPLSPH
jgi:transcriptional regulator with XRE-family HTH domain